MIKTPIGELMLIQSEKGLKRIVFEKKISAFLSEIEQKKDDYNLVKDKISLKKPIKQINDYFSNNKKFFDIKVDISMPSFYQKVLLTVMKIPYGEVRTYQEIAIKTGSPNAYRAVGSANAKNLIPIIIPCHRVVAANGNLGGYGGGLSIKKYLLKMEGVI
ncbi:MAG: methylated-DNA--[protein]-cysteine S-methyltransferase [Candidatus Neomarinimicrobiota bacterium]|jgi:methylated-DNA-[protein]-cysteine S-methyltransferase|nr:methylated-DNA--[protein]-cysteine S-methyltransferase [Candidatus Neomarinimicrobiota bacterium]